MNQKLLVAVAGVALVSALFVIFSGTDSGEKNVHPQKEQSVGEQKSEVKKESGVEIKYEAASQAKESRAASSVAVQREQKVSEEKPKVPNVIAGTMARTAKYELMLASESKPKPKQSAAPLPPTVIAGTIDGEVFNMVLPSALDNDDIKFVVRSMESGETKVATSKLGVLDAGSKYSAQLYFHSLDSMTFLKDTSAPSVSDFPPMPPVFK